MTQSNLMLRAMYGRMVLEFGRFSHRTIAHKVLGQRPRFKILLWNRQGAIFMYIAKVQPCFKAMQKSIYL